VALWVGSLDNGVCPRPEEAEEEGMVASSSSEISGSGVETDLLDLDVPPIFQLFEDSLEVSFRSSFTRGYGRHPIFWDVKDSIHLLNGVLVDEMIWGFIGPVGMTSEGGLVGKLSIAQRTLMDVWGMCLSVEGP
jgi:hypothetical protein